MKLLFICPFLPSKNASQAGHRLAYEYIVQYSLIYEVDVILLLKGEKPITNELNDLENVNVILHHEFKMKDLLFNFIFHFFSFPFRTRYSTRVEKQIKEFIATKNYEVINFEFSQTFVYIQKIREVFGIELTIHLAAHDIQTQAYLRLNGLRSFLSANVFKAERLFVNLADKILVLSDKDKYLVKSLFGESIDVDVRNIPLPEFVSKVQRTEKTIEKDSIMFWGAMNRMENEDSIINFIERIYLPYFKGEKKLYIVGSRPSKKLQNYASEHIIITGFVDNPIKFFETAQIGIVPLIHGAGVKLKTLEMLNTGMQVVSTPIGCEGISTEKFPNLIISEMDNFGDTLKNIFTK